MEKLERSSLDYHFKHGLPKNVDTEGTISLILNTRSHKILKYHTFQTNTKPNDLPYDIPVYCPKAPDKFSIFTTKKEIADINSYLQTRNKSSEAESELTQLQILYADNDVDNPEKIPLPRKEHNYCHLCSSRFDDFLSHIKSEPHSDKKNANKHLFKLIDKKFSEIREFWTRQKEEVSSKKEEVNLNPENLTQIQNHFTYNLSTKYQTEQTSANALRENTQQMNCDTKHKKEPECNELQINKENINSANLILKKNNIMNDLTAEFENFETQTNVTYKYNLTKKYKERGFTAIAANLKELSSLIGKSLAFKIK